MLNEDESFNLTANVISPGYQSVVVRGYLVSERPDGTYIAPLIPQLFYGVSGTQLQTWRQYLPGTGQQTIISRVGGQPSVPREELYWRKIKERRVPTVEEPAPTWITPEVIVIGLAILSGVVLTALWSGR